MIADETSLFTIYLRDRTLFVQERTKCNTVSGSCNVMSLRLHGKRGNVISRRKCSTSIMRQGTAKITGNTDVHFTAAHTSIETEESTQFCDPAGSQLPNAFLTDAQTDAQHGGVTILLLRPNQRPHLQPRRNPTRNKKEVINSKIVTLPPK